MEAATENRDQQATYVILQGMAFFCDAFTVQKTSFPEVYKGQKLTVELRFCWIWENSIINLL